MSESPAPWTSWWQDDLPCHFTKAQTADNQALLEDTLDRSWLSSAHHRAEHPLLSRWAGGGAGSFLELNGLAEDVRLLRGVPGFETVLHDLKNASTTLSAWHVVHGAALFERHTLGCVVQFFPQEGAESVLDFLLRWQGADIAVEAKLLTQSETEHAFNRYGDALVRRVFEGVFASPAFHPVAIIVVKDARHLPDTDHVVAGLAHALQSYAGGPLVARGPAFNIFLEPPVHDLSALSEYRRCDILGPKSDDEDLRVAARGKKASGQLRAYGDGAHAGVFLLGVGGLVDPPTVAALLQSRFERGFFRGISGAILVQRGTHAQPPVRSVIDLIAFVRNASSARVILPEDLGIAPHGLYGKFAPSGGVPAYRIAQVAGRLRTAGGTALMLPDIRILTPDLLG